MLKSFAAFSPIIFSMWYNMKNIIEIKTGIPKPPFLIIDPRGAPTRNNNMHAMAKLIFLCHSILCFVRIIFLYFKSSLFDLMIDLSVLILFIAILYFCFLALL